jgi:hypothetical protein
MADTDVIDFMREQFARLNRRLDAFDIWRRETAPRLTNLEREIGHLTANEHDHYASVSLRLDNIATRLERIERRLELTDVPH